MAGMVRTGGSVEAEPNVIPMIDVLLVMLVIFMLLNLRVRPFIPVQLPPPTAGPAAVTTQIVLEVRADGSYALNGQPVPGDHLESALRAIYEPRPSRLLFIKAAPNRQYQEVITAMDRARGAGVQVIGMVPAAPMLAAGR